MDCSFRINHIRRFGYGVDMMNGQLIIIKSYFTTMGLAFAFSWAGYWLFRKLSARLQARRGPPWYQPLADLIKLFGKELFIPKLANRTIYILAPLIALSSIFVLTFIIPPGISDWPGSLSWDIIVILYLLVMFTLAFVLAGGASGSPWGKVGASREVAIILSVELPLAITLLIPSIALRHLGFDFSLSLNEVIASQFEGKILGVLPNWFLFRYPLAAISLFICLLTKAWMRPFGDIPEAEQEIFMGPITEYGGPLLGIFELARMLRFYVFPALFVDLYMGGGDGLLFPYNLIVFLIKCLVIVVFMTIMHVANARYRISQTFRWFLTFGLGLALIDLIRVLVL